MQHYNHLFAQEFEKQASLKLGAINFEKRPKRGDLFKIDKLKKIEYDNTKVIAGLDAVKQMKVRGAVKFSTHSRRDHAIFPFDKLDLKDVEKQTARIRSKIFQPKFTSKLQFSDSIPTNMEPKLNSTR